MSENQNIDRDVLELMGEVVDSVGLQEMEDRFRGLALEEQYVMPDVRHWIVSINPYPRVIACALKFNTNSSSVSTVDNIEAHESILQVNSNTIRTSMVFVWSAKNGVNIVTKAKFQNSTLGAGYGVQVFPVLTLGMDDSPIPRQHIDQQIRNNYDIGNYLIYATSVNMKPKEFVGIPDDGSTIPDEDIGKFMKYKFEQRFDTNDEDLICACFGLNLEYPEEISVSIPISTIISTRNPVLPLAGIYAGGPMPTDVRRVSHNQPLVSENSQIAGNFRFEIDDQKNGERDGILCSNGSLCVIQESLKAAVSDRGQQGFTNLLLTESTFAIIDGYNRYNYRGLKAKNTVFNVYNFRVHWSEHSHHMPLSPKMIILFEGLYRLVIIESDFRANFRNSILVDSYLDRFPIVLDWYALQRDLELSRPHTKRAFQQIMHYNDIYDCVRHRYGQHSYLFSLASYLQPFFNNFIEQWNVYVLIEGTDDNGYYYLVGRVAHKYRGYKNGCLLSSCIYYESPFGVEITESQFVHRNEFVEPVYRQIQTQGELKEFIRRLGSTPVSQIKNPNLILYFRNDFLLDKEIVIN